MCVLSMIIGHGQQRWPLPNPWVFPQSPIQPWQQPVPPPALPNSDDWEWFKKMVEAAKEYDRKTKQPDCEDPAKVDWMKRMTEILEKIEEKL